MTEWEAWIEGDAELTFSTVNRIEEMKARGLLPDRAKLLHRISAETPEEAHAILHLRMGRDPYRPIGEAIPCPNNCGSSFYPEGSGICPYCGKVA